MVSYYNSLAMFPNRHAPQSSSPAAAAAAAAAAYLGYHGYHHTHHPHHHHHHASHHHVHPQASPPTAPPATHHQSHHLHHNIGHHLPHHQYTVENHEIGGNGGVHAMGGAGMNHLSGHQHHQYAPPTPPSQYDHSPHHHIPHHLLQHHAHSEGEGQSPQPLGAAAAAPVAWHSPVYSASSCTRGPESAPGMTGGVYEGWSPQPPMQPAMGSSVPSAAPQGSPPPPSSVTPDYKLAPGLDFSMSGSPAMVGMASQQPQDLSNGSTPSAVPMGGVSLPLLPAASLPAHHASPDSGLAGSSDGVSSSAGSPQHMHHLQHSHVHSQMGQQGMQMAMQPSQQVLLQAAADEMRQHPQQQSQHQPQGDQHQQQQPRPQPVRSPYEWMKKPSYQSQPNPGKTRTKDKYRVVYSDRQRLELEKEFHYSRYITIRRKSELATALGLSDRQVKIWFQNRRAKERKHLKKREEVAHKDKVEGGDSSQQQPREQISDQMPPDLIPNQLHIGAHTLHHAQHLHHHHSHQHHADLTEAPSQQQQPPMVLPLSSVTIGGVDL